MKKLDYQEWEELKAQVMRTYSEAPTEFVPVEHAKLIYLLDRLGFATASEAAALLLAEELLQIGWT